MMKVPIVDLLARGRELAARGERVSVLWQEPESLAFVARGREYRSEFHINPSDEVMLAGGNIAASWASKTIVRSP
jgi:3-hydroxyanthranilate 3,4-dioxygenase